MTPGSQNIPVSFLDFTPELLQTPAPQFLGLARARAYARRHSGLDDLPHPPLSKRGSHEEDEFDVGCRRALPERFGFCW